VAVNDNLKKNCKKCSRNMVGERRKMGIDLSDK
jgi:hypothetical protein